MALKEERQRLPELYSAQELSQLVDTPALQTAIRSLNNIQARFAKSYCIQMYYQRRIVKRLRVILRGNGISNQISHPVIRITTLRRLDQVPTSWYMELKALTQTSTSRLTRQAMSE
jgi:hypothetical protein